MPDEVLTIKEIAALLKLAEKTAYAMAQAGEIPAFKIRGQWRIQATPARGILMKMADWASFLTSCLELSSYPILADRGKVSAVEARLKAESEYEVCETVWLTQLQLATREVA